MRPDEPGRARHEHRAHSSDRQTQSATRIALAIIVNVWFLDGSGLSVDPSAI